MEVSEVVEAVFVDEPSSVVYPVELSEAFDVVSVDPAEVSVSVELSVEGDVVLVEISVCPDGFVVAVEL